MLTLLLLFNQPLYVLKDSLPESVYQLVFQDLLQTSFFGVLLYFWLVLIHSLSESDHVSIDERRFYLPKKVLCGAMWACLVFYRDSLSPQTIINLSPGA